MVKRGEEKHEDARRIEKSELGKRRYTRHHEARYAVLVNAFTIGKKDKVAKAGASSVFV